jgi:hypothetical protein
MRERPKKGHHGRPVTHARFASRRCYRPAHAQRWPVTIYPDASHAINGEYPEKIAADVETFRRGL